MSVLILDNNIDTDSWGARDLVRYATRFSGATVHVRRPPHRDLPKDPLAYDRFILSGSRTSALENAPWIESLHELIRTILNARKPFLGICFGHQSLIRALGGVETMREAATPEYGWSEIEILAKSAIFSGFPSKFHSFSSHRDEAAFLPPTIRNLARSADCAIQACAVADAPAYGVQFHPEKDASAVKRFFSGTKVPAKKLLRPRETEKLYRPEIAETLFRNFFQP